MRPWSLAGLVIIAGGCAREDASRAEAAQKPPVEVGVVEIRPQRVLLTTELPGRTSAVRAGEVRARVDGIVLQRLYQEGADVQQGQQLFQIDPAPYRAALQSADAQLKSAEASASTAKLLAERYARLIKQNAVSRQEYDNAVAQEKSARASVDAARAQVKTAEINLGYTRVYAPISGRSGRSIVPVGAYVQQSQATLLTTVTQLDPMYVDTTWSTAELLRVRRELEHGQLTTIEGKPRVDVVLEDGRPYDHPGTLLVTGVTVDETTGSVPLRAVVPNPGGVLLPGMYVRARIQEGADPNALLVPQRGVARDRTGGATALVVGNEGKVELRKLRADRAVGNAWLVTEGLKAGDRVIVEGAQRAQPGATVKAVAVPAEIGEPQPPAQPAQPRQPQVQREKKPEAG
ncbi:MAG: efflux RND transporter periplasmic adaptor subunit [Deltaproteobacteria bacterium]|nr:efflux RND transporter periplasmic adaptor subunit [Deltaproteobacteria bacterium]